MKDYHLLMNSTYLYLLAHPDERINYSKIAKELEKTRQTVAKEYKEIEDNLEQKNYLDKVIFDLHTDEKNSILRAIKIMRDIDHTDYTNLEIANSLGVSRASLSKYLNHPPMSAVYVCLYKGNLIYVGSTSDYKSRLEEHYSGIKVHGKAKLYQYLKDKEIKDIEFVPILTNINKSLYLELEKNLIQTLKPICNVQFLE